MNGQILCFLETTTSHPTLAIPGPLSTFTFSGSCNPIVYQGATPVFVDSESETWNMDPSLLEKAIVDRMAKGKKPKACIVVHLYGMSAKIEKKLSKNWGGMLAYTRQQTQDLMSASSIASGSFKTLDEFGKTNPHYTQFDAFTAKNV